MTKALIVSRNFPPTGSVGASVRITKFLKYLSREGWSFFVLTQDPEHPVIVEPYRSDILLRELPGPIRIDHIPAPWRVSDIMPDRSMIRTIANLLWSLGVISRGLQVIRKEKAELIYTNMPHFINGLIGAVLGLVSGLPLVVDMKDDVVGTALHLSKSRVRQRMERLAEKLIFQTASKVTFATMHSLQVYQARYPAQRANFISLPNGCDLDEFLLDCAPSTRIPEEKFLILNAAMRYRKDYRDASPFLHTIATFIRKHPEARERVNVVFLGNSLEDEYWQTIEKLGLDGLVYNVPFADREDYLSWLKRANLLFLVQPYGNRTSTSGTLYEYWATAGAPVLLFAEKGASRELVESRQIGCAFDFEDLDGAIAYIEQVYFSAKAGNQVRISRSGIETFDRKKLALKMHEVWKSCTR